MRKLTVKNFSVIKEAELEFGKITVLIGPQSSGKSLLCRLSYFLTKQTIELALRAILGPKPLDESKFDVFKRETCVEFLRWFSLETWYDKKDASVSFESHRFSARVFLNEESRDIQAEFSSSFQEEFASLAALIGENQSSGPDSRLRIAEQVKAQLLLLITESDVADPYVDRHIYIPDGRAFFANQSLGFNVVNNPDIDPIIKEFSLEVSWGNTSGPSGLLGEEGVRVLSEMLREMVRIAGGHIEGKYGSARFIRHLDGKSIPLPRLSSGTQAILPMFNVLGQRITDQRDRILFPRPDNLPGMPNEIILSKSLVYLEEPEANIFPSTQYDLIRLFSWLSRETRTDFSWVITTHSPYILSSFNNLIEAGQAARNNPALHDEVAKIIPEQYWIKEGDFKAYAIEGGKMRSILNESGFIEGNYLDQVSEVIGNEFDKLLRLEYEHTKAS